MKKTKRRSSEKQPLGARLRQRLRVQDEPRFYFILQLVFAATQILIAYVAFLGDNLTNAGVLIFAFFGVLMMLLAGKAWQHRAARIFGRVVSVVVVLGFLLVLVLDATTTQVTDSKGLSYVTRSFGDYVGQLGAYLCSMVQPLLLALFPTFAIAARRVGKKADIHALRMGGWALVLLAAGTLALSYEKGMTRLNFSVDLFGIGNRVLLIAYLVCTLASTLSVFMAYPYGVRWLKAKIDKARAKAQKTDNETEK